MADYAVMYDTRPDTAVYGSVLIDRVVYDKSADADERDTNPAAGKCARLLAGLSAARAFQSLRSEPRFRDALTRMSECAGV